MLKIVDFGTVIMFFSQPQKFCQAALEPVTNGNSFSKFLELRVQGLGDNAVMVPLKAYDTKMIKQLRGKNQKRQKCPLKKGG